MKISHRILGVLLCMGALHSTLSAQKFAADYLRGGIDDGNKLLGAYLKPFGNGIGAGLNNGWYNTAETHKTLGFSVNVIANVSFVPTDDKTYNIQDLNLSNLTLQNPANSVAPTVMGANADGPGLEILVDDPATPGVDRDLVLTRFNAPKGTGIGFLPTPMIQGAVGLPKGTEIMVRFMPTVSSSGVNGKFNLFGFGVKHDIKQWIPVVSELPFDVSVMGAFTRMNMGVDLNLQPDVNSVSNQAVYSNQEMLFNVNAITANFIVSKKIAFFTPHISAGFNSSRARLRVQGDYPIVTDVIRDNASPDYGKKLYTDVTDPIDTKFENEMDFRVNAGFRLKMFGVMCLSLDYTYARYSTLTMGLGVAFR
jgi:hypothetical protein